MTSLSLDAFPSPPAALPNPGLSPTRPRMLRPPRTVQLTSRALKRLQNRPASLKLALPGDALPREVDREGCAVREWKRDDRVERWRSTVAWEDELAGARLVVGEPSEKLVEELEQFMASSLPLDSFTLPDLQLPLSPAAPQITPDHSLTGIPTPTTDVHTNIIPIQAHPIMVPTVTYSRPHDRAYDNLRSRAHAAALTAEERKKVSTGARGIRDSQVEHLFPHRAAVNNFTGAPYAGVVQEQASSSEGTLSIHLRPAAPTPHRAAQQDEHKLTQAITPTSAEFTPLPLESVKSRYSTYALTPVDLHKTPPKAAALLGIFTYAPRQNTPSLSRVKTPIEPPVDSESMAPPRPSFFSRRGGARTRKDSMSSSSSLATYITNPFAGGGRPSMSSYRTAATKVEPLTNAFNYSTSSLVHPFTPPTSQAAFPPREDSLASLAAHARARSEEPTSPAPFEVLLTVEQPNEVESKSKLSAPPPRPAKSALRPTHKAGKSLPALFGSPRTPSSATANSANGVRIEIAPPVPGKSTLTPATPRKLKRRSASQPNLLLNAARPPLSRPPSAARSPSAQAISQAWVAPDEWDIESPADPEAEGAIGGFTAKLELPSAVQKARLRDFEVEKREKRMRWERESAVLRDRLSKAGVGPAPEEGY